MHDQPTLGHDDVIAALDAIRAELAKRARRPTRVVGEQIKSRDTDIAFYGDPRHCAFAGGVPIGAHGAVIGGIGVSGLSDDDEALAMLGAAAALRG
jgi:glc operon protein GlcG